MRNRIRVLCTIVLAVVVAQSVAVAETLPDPSKLDDSQLRTTLDSLMMKNFANAGMLDAVAEKCPEFKMTSKGREYRKQIASKVNESMHEYLMKVYDQGHTLGVNTGCNTKSVNDLMNTLEVEKVNADLQAATAEVNRRHQK